MIENNCMWLKSYFFNFWRPYILFVGPLIPCYRVLIMSHLGFKAALFALGRCIHITYSQKFTSSVTPSHLLPVSLVTELTRHWWLSNGNLIVAQSNAVPTGQCLLTIGLNLTLYGLNPTS